MGAAETYSQALGRGDELIDPAAWIWRLAFGWRPVCWPSGADPLGRPSSFLMAVADHQYPDGGRDACGVRIG